MGRRFEGWAPPGRVWGPWIEIAAQIGGPLAWDVEFESISDAPSTFDAEIVYWQGSEQRSDIVVGPGRHRFVAGICACVSRIRFRSHTLGQMVKVSISP